MGVQTQPGNHDHEVSWKVLTTDDRSTVCEVTVGDAGANAVSECCAPAGTETTVECKDAFGDGWNGYRITFTHDSGTVEICENFSFSSGHNEADSFTFPEGSSSDSGK